MTPEIIMLSRLQCKVCSECIQEAPRLPLRRFGRSGSRMDQPPVSFADEARRHAGADKPTTGGPHPQGALPIEQRPTPKQPAHEDATEAKAAARATEAEAPATPAPDGGEQKT